MIINNNYSSGNRVPVLHLVEPRILSYEIDRRTIVFTAEYEVNRHCVLVGYADARESANIFNVIQGMPELDYTALLKHHGIIKVINREIIGTDIFESGKETTVWDATPEQIHDELKNIVCVIIE